MHPELPSSILIVGAGHCGGRTAQALRAQGYSGRIDLVGDEPGLPYERPPLSKGVLTGETEAASLDLWKPEQLAALDLQRHAARVVALDAGARQATLSDGTRLAWDALLLATGGAPRALDIPGADLPGVLSLRTRADAQQLGPRLASGRRLAIIGGGFIGLEAAASARARGCTVHVVEGAPQLMGRAVPALLAERAQALHQAQGVALHLGVRPLSLHATPDGALALALSSGEVLDADTVLVGIGIVPGVALAQSAGIAVARGILVDRQLRTNVPGVFAAGDVAEFPSPLSGALQRQETWQNAEAQAQVAAQNLIGGSAEFTATPWFWSDQYDHQLQVSGEPAGAAHSVLRQLPEGDLLVFYTDAQQRIVAACSWGQFPRLAREQKLARTLVERGVRASAAQLADPGVGLKSLLR